MNFWCFTSNIYRVTPLLLIAAVGAAFYESTMPPTINDKVNAVFGREGALGYSVIPHLDKIAHFFTFGLIALLISIVLSHLTSSIGRLTIAITSLGLATLLGLANEYIQSFSPGRATELNDVLADMAGAIVFLTVWAIVRMRVGADWKGGSVKMQMVGK
ncbi:MAG: hypothetical protein AUJ57_09870 [Zetaproteobacteria bacterium CG1_02_53_45]|nr:MAG: hypothetical protein AUJ57_09870 [Zetaproteobacteria bacterium CG1_02_53_45]